MKVLTIVLIDIILFTIGYVLGFFFAKHKWSKKYYSVLRESERIFDANKALQLELKKKQTPKRKTVVKENKKKEVKPKKVEPKKTAVSTKEKPTKKVKK